MDKKILLQNIWMLLGYWAFFSLGGWGLSQFDGFPGTPNYLIVGWASLGLWLGSQVLPQAGIKREHRQQLTFRQWLLAGSGGFAAIVMLLLTLVVMLASIDISPGTLTPAATAELDSYRNMLLLVHGLTMLVVVLCYPAKIRYVVPEESVVLQAGRLYRPGETYIYSFLFSATPDIIPERIPVHLSQVQLSFVDGLIVNATVAASVKLFFSKASEATQSLTAAQIREEASKFLRTQLQKLASQKTLLHLLQDSHMPASGEVDGVRMVWSGGAQFSIPDLSIKAL